jgi:hypothetical protein
MNTKQPVVGGNIHHNEAKSLFKKKYSFETKYLPYSVHKDTPQRGENMLLCLAVMLLVSAFLHSNLSFILSRVPCLHH